MPQIVFVRPDGQRMSLTGKDGDSAMQVAVASSLDGIVAECGGNAMCATCHVYVDPQWRDRLPAISDDEEALLEGAAAPRTADSRLSCQIRLTTDLDGLTLHLPDRQT
jgi:2Fe-2S ferredoxin